MSLIPWRKPAAPQRATTLQSEFNRFFDDFLGAWPSWPAQGESWAPPLSVEDDAKALTIKAELPGMTPEDVEVSVTDNVLTLRGHKKHEKQTKDSNMLRSEMYYGSFMRQVALPSDIDTEHVEATMDNGVLRLRLPKAPGAKSKTIKVK